MAKTGFRGSIHSLPMTQEAGKTDYDIDDNERQGNQPQPSFPPRSDRNAKAIYQARHNREDISQQGTLNIQ